MLRVSHSPASGQVAPKAVTGEIEVVQAQVLPPLLKIVNKIIDGLIRRRLVTVVVEGSRAATHTRNVDQEEAEMLCHLLEYFEKQRPRATPAVDKDEDGLFAQVTFTLLLLTFLPHQILPCTFSTLLSSLPPPLGPGIVVTAHDCVNVHSVAFEGADGDIHGTDLVAGQA